MIEWLISPSAGTASLDARSGDIDFRDAEDALELLDVYIRAGVVGRVLIDGSGRIFLPGPVEVLVLGLIARGRRYGIQVEVADQGCVAA
jgi:hypothetical protein